MAQEMTQAWSEYERNRPIFKRKRSVHFNVMFKDSGMASRVFAWEIAGNRPSEIEWILMVEEGRKATLLEIRQLCAGKWKG